MTYDCIVIGAGPAGMVAAVQLKRAGLKVSLIEKGEVGGLLRNANRVENYMGFPNASGKELIKYFQDHLNEQKVPLIKEEVMEIGRDGEEFHVKTSNNNYLSRSVLIATGTIPKKACIEGEDNLAGTKLFYEVADMPDEDKKDIVIIGGGDAAFDYALNLTGKEHKVTIVTRGDISCLPLLKERADKQKIKFLTNTPVLSIQQASSGLEVQCKSDSLHADYVFVAVGREPSYPRIAMQNREGLYFVGDVQSGQYRQVHIALGDALRVAMKISSSLLTATT